MKISLATAAEPRTICVFLPNWVGDVAMATPALRELRRRFPAPTRIVGVGKPHLFTVLEGTPWIDESIAYDHRSTNPAMHASAVIDRLISFRADTAVLLASSFTTAWVAWRSGARRRIGFARNLRGWLLTDRVAEPGSFWKKTPWPTVDQYLALAVAAGCESSHRTLEIATTAKDEQAADRIWRDLRLVGRRVVCVNNHSAGATSRWWPEERLFGLCRKLAEDPRNSILLLCGPKEQDKTAEWAQRLDHPRITSLAGQDMALGTLKAVLRRSELLVTTDSGPRHLAAALGTPVVALLGPIDSRWTMNYHADEIRLSEPVPCGPCGRKTCPLADHPCMSRIAVEQVVQAAGRLLDKPRALATLKRA
ncbi:MAG: glycosyltransferase family 9 protein [Planctomycetota bacterium]